MGIKSKLCFKSLAVFIFLSFLPCMWVVAQQKDKIRIVWATAITSTTPSYTDMVAWAKWMEKRSADRIQIVIRPDESILKAGELLDGVKYGTADMADIHLGIYAGRFALHDIVMLPMLFSYPSARTAGLAMSELFQKYHKEFDKEFSEIGVKLLGYMPQGAGQLHTKVKLVKSLDDLKGLVLDVHGGRYLIETIKAMGAIPETPAPAEGYDMLAKGITQGIIGEYEFVVSSGFAQLLKYTTEVGSLSMSFEAIIMNNKTWSKLPPDLQKLMIEGVKYFTDVHGYLMDQRDVACKKQLEEMYHKRNGLIYVLPADERKKWVDVAKSSWDMWITSLERKGVKEARNMLSEMLRLAEKYAYGRYPVQEAEKLVKEWGITK